jgi:hypothetical protein
MDKKTYKEFNGILVITPHNYKKDFKDCPVCGFALRHKEDLIEINKNNCCMDCMVHFMHANKKKWEEGWRPSRKEAQKAIIKNNTGD